MPAPKGNQFWKLRTKHGRDKVYSDPDVLLSASYEYFETCNKNPWYKNDAVRSGKNVGKIISVPTQRPYTLVGLCVFLGITKQTWYNWKETASKDFIDIITHVEEVIQQNQLEGATVGAYNHNIIARLMGLADKQEHSGSLEIKTSEKSKKKIDEIGND